MATEILAIPEARLAEVIAVLKAGLAATTVSTETRTALEQWNLARD